MAHMTKTGRVYERGRAFNNDLRRNIIQDIVENGGDFVTGFFPGNLPEIALKKQNKIRLTWLRRFVNNSASLVRPSCKVRQEDQHTFNPMTLSYYGFWKPLEPLCPRVNFISMWTTSVMLLVGHPSLRYIEHCKRTWTVENVLGRNLHTLSRRNLALKTWITAKNLWITFTHYAFNSDNINIQLITVVVHCWHPLYTISLIKWRQIM